MKVCPTDAIRIRKGKAVLAENRCVDCGECFRACPVCAIEIEQDDFDKIFQYKVRIALMPAIFVGQFPEVITTDRIYSELMEIGFTHVYEVENGVDILLPEMEGYLKNYEGNKPVLSSFCPAIVRLIQVKFPALTEQIMLLKPPVDISAIYNRKKFIDAGFKPEEIGIFYITPCAAKIAAVKSPVGDKFPEVDGVINMNFLFNKVYTSIKNNQNTSNILPFRESMNEKCIVWCLTRGESIHTIGRSLAIDGIHNVIEFLEKLENEEHSNIEFLELRGCDESCAGGVLATGNRFLIAERLHNRADLASKRQMRGIQKPGSILNYKEYIESRIQVEKIKPRSIMKLDDDMAEAMRKMQKVHELLMYLPMIDCGGCGSPSCESLAEDVVQGKGSVAQCIYVQRNMEERKVFTHEEAMKILKDTWGEDKFNRKWSLNL
jgi:iron only hydrogenase large subunit-like protein